MYLLPVVCSKLTETAEIRIIKCPKLNHNLVVIARFLFEGSEGNALYTGDFRWESDQIMRVPALHVDQR